MSVQASPDELDLIGSILKTSSDRRQAFMRIAALRPHDLRWPFVVFAAFSKVSK